MNLTLYQIANEYAEAANKLADMDLPPEAISDTLEGVRGDLQVKAQNIAMVMRNLESLADAIKQAEDQMKHRRKVIENRINSINEYVKTCMESAGVSKIESPYLSMTIRKNPPSVIIDDVDSIPPKYIHIPELPPPMPDKSAIGRDLKSGKDIPGTHLEQTTRLVIS